MPEQLELEVAAPEFAAHTSEITQEKTAFEETPDAPDGTEKTVASQEGEQSDGEQNKDVIETAQQKSEKKLSGIQKRLNELTRDKYTEREARQNLERQNSELMALLKGQKPASQQPTDNAQPTQDQYTDYAEFVKADAVFHATKAAKAIMEQSTKAQNETQQRQAFIQSEAIAAQTYANRAKETAKSVPDFAEVMAEADNIEVPTPVINMLRRLENGPLVAYHMVKNPALAQQFNEAPPAMHGVLLGQLSATLKGSAKVSNAPPPGKSVKSQAGSSNEPPEDTDAYMVWAAKNMR